MSYMPQKGAESVKLSDNLVSMSKIHATACWKPDMVKEGAWNNVSNAMTP
ncbi:MAG: hypothetical protein LBJ41_11375 [Treponema sp.]|jgi:hypothetical protein|nr:hypothetical protein [Treponema sp.]